MASCAPPTRPRSPAISGPRPRRWPGATGCAGSRAARRETPYWRYGGPCREGDRDGGPAAHQLCPARSDGRADAGGNGAMQPGGNPAAGELGGPGARARLLLVLRPVLGRDLPARRLRPPDQGAVPRLHLPLGELRVLRQPAFGPGGGPGPHRGQVRRAAELREVGPLHRAGEGGARLRGDDRMHAHFSEPELVELGCAIGLTFGQQSWLRMLNIGHHEVMPGTAASLAPGFETPADMAATMDADDYWAKR